MNDRELSNLLREWRPSRAPVSLEERVFGPTRVPGWWERIPAGPVAALGTLAGVLVVLLLLSWVPTEPVAAPEAPAAKTTAPEPPPAPAVSLPTTTKMQPAVKAKPAPRPKPVPEPALADLVTTPPRLVYNPMPAYPAEAPPLLAAVIVKVRIHVGTDGRIAAAELVEGDPVLGDLAVEAVKQWLYIPEIRGGQPVETVTEVNVTFGPRGVPPRPVGRPKGRAR